MSRKKALVRTLENVVYPGYLPLSGLLEDSSPPAVCLLDPGGRLVSIELRQIRSVAYVRDFNLDNTQDPENLLRRSFLARPRTEGLWVRVTFTAGDTLEGLAPLDVSLADGWMIDRGVFLIPPDIRSNTQRVFVPRTAIAQMQILGVITTPSKPARPEKRPSLQEDLFPASES